MQTQPDNAAAQPPSKPGRGRPARISRDAIGKAALRVGLELATVTEVARVLGVDHSTLYRHISSAAEIRTLAADRAISSVSWTPEGGDWRALLEHMGTTLWQLLEDTPGLANILLQFDLQSEAVYTAFAQTVEALARLGFDYVEAGRVVDLLADLTIQTHSSYAALSDPDDEGTPLRSRLLAQAETVATARPELSRAANEAARMIQDNPYDHWRWRMDLVLDGMAKRQ